MRPLAAPRNGGTNEPTNSLSELQLCSGNFRQWRRQFVYYAVPYEDECPLAPRCIAVPYSNCTRCLSLGWLERKMSQAQTFIVCCYASKVSIWKRMFPHLGIFKHLVNRYCFVWTVSIQLSQSSNAQCIPLSLIPSYNKGKLWQCCRFSNLSPSGRAFGLFWPKLFFFWLLSLLLHLQSIRMSFSTGLSSLAVLYLSTSCDQ